MPYELASSTLLRAARESVVEAFLLDCRQRSKAAELPEGLFASGQFFNEPKRRQRGLHGTASALRVLASQQPSNQAANETASGILCYLKNRRSVELKIAELVQASRRATKSNETDEVAYWAEKFRHDSLNTSKQAEVLYALAFVRPAHGDGQELVQETYSRILQGKALDDNGWGWTLQNETTSDETATAFVIRSLHKNGFDTRNEGQWLRSQLLSRHDTEHVDLLQCQADCLILQVLLEVGAVSQRESRQPFQRLWHKLSERLDEPDSLRRRWAESGKERTVLVHWQFHLAAVAYWVRPWRGFLSGSIQKCLVEAARAVSDTRTINRSYDESSVSTRHYMYFYDLIDICAGELGSNGLLDNSVASGFARTEPIRKSLQRYAWLIPTAVATVITGIVLADWIQNGWSWRDLAPELIGPVIVGVIAIAARRLGRRP